MLRGSGICTTEGKDPVRSRITAAIAAGLIVTVTAPMALARVLEG